MENKESWKAHRFIYDGNICVGGRVVEIPEEEALAEKARLQTIAEKENLKYHKLLLAK